MSKKLVSTYIFKEKGFKKDRFKINCSCDSCKKDFQIALRSLSLPIILCAKCKSKQTCLEKYGVEYSFQSENNKSKSKETCLNNYGVENASKSEIIKKKISEKHKGKHLSEDTKQKIRQKTKGFYRGNPIQQKPQHIYETLNERKERLKKARQAFKDKYKKENPFQLNIVKQKIKKTCLERYGNENYNNSEKALKTRLEKYGNHAYSNCVPCRYFYNFETFDSSWELAYYIFLKDHNIEFEYHPSPIKYQDNDKSRRYFPDFIVNNKIIEIKGSQLMNKNGKLKDHGKQKLLEEIHATIISDAEILTYLNYVSDTYGKEYLKSFKI